MQKFQERLKQARLDSNLTQKQVAEKVGLTEHGYQNYEAGRRDPKFYTVIALADLLGVNLDYLAGRVDEKTEQYQSHDN